MIAEYTAHVCPYVPQCGDFVNSTTSPFSANFNFSSLNFSYFSDWAIIRPYFVSDIQGIYNKAAFTTNSAYRDPDKEYDITAPNYHPGSRHQFGDAIDIATANQSVWNTFKGYAKGSGGACVEPAASQGGSYAHLHADWRTASTAFARWTTGCPPKW